MTVTVLCLNDYPIGAYSDPALAEAAALEDWRKREPSWREQGLELGQSLSGMYKYMCYFYHQHVFTVDAEARL
jgi:hypothetical protein